MDLIPGQSLGRYELVRPIGRGGAGEVWEGILHGPQGFERAVALKLIRPDVAGRLSREALFEEARLGALLHHPNVVSTHELGEVDGRFFLAMELVRGASLGALAKAAPLSARALLDVAVQLCAGLLHLHRLTIDGRPAGLVHRDVKPSNVLVDSSGLIKLADLGVAALGGEVRHRTGTPGYLSPEQAAGAVQDARSDLFSVGATLYRVIVGRHLLRLPEPEGLSALLEDPATLEPVERAVPGLGAVLHRCVQPSPDHRWPDAGALGAALSALVDRQAPGPSLVEALARVRPDLQLETLPTSRTPGLSTSPTVFLQGRLPGATDQFFGRDQDLADLLARFGAGDTLATLMGPGGMGKTRLALEVARRLGPSMEGGAWFCDLSEARGKEGAVAAAAEALGVQLSGDDDVDRIGWALADRGPCLVILDNLEQVVGPAASCLDRWRGLAPEVTWLCTSRVALRLRGERRVTVGPLPHADARNLFVDRLPEAPEPREEPVVDRLVTALEGMPLAIELCAARSRWASLAALEQRLHRRLDLLAGGERDRPERHRSVRASLDGSWALLTAEARSALAQLSVFEGGFTIEAAEATLDLGGVWVLDALGALADASLVRRVPGGDRFAMLRVVQDYAAEQLDEEVRARTEERHGTWAAQLGSPAALWAVAIRGGGPRFETLCEELDNLFAAARRAAARGDEATMVPAAEAIATILGRRGPFTAAVQLLEPLSATPGLSDGARARLIQLSAIAHRRIGHADRAIARFENAEAILRQGNHPAALAVVLSNLVTMHRAQGRHERALALAAEAMPLLEAAGDRRALATVHDDLGLLRTDTGALDSAEAHFGAALAIHREGHDRQAEGGTMSNLAILRIIQGRPEEAADLFTGALRAHRDTGDRRSEAIALGNLGSLRSEQGRLEDSEAASRAALTLHRSVGDRRSAAVVMGNLGILAVHRGRHDEAERRYREALVAHREVGNVRSENVVLGNLGALYVQTGDLDQARAHLEQALVLARRLGHHSSEAAWLGRLAGIALAEEDLDAAGRRVAEATIAARAGGHDRVLAEVLGIDAKVRHRAGHLPEAAARLEEALAIADRISAAPDGLLLRELHRVRDLLAGGS